MSSLFQNKYRIPSTRHPHWDYGWNAAYFVTICTANKEHYFGTISNNEMRLSEIGEVVHQCWLNIPEHFPFVILDQFVIMPNHLHGILIFNKDNNTPQCIENKNIKSVETQDFASLQNKFGAQSRNLSSVIRGFKIGVKKYATQNAILFKWQPRFYDVIIRNIKQHEAIRDYIYNNPLQWKDDELFTS